MANFSHSPSRGGLMIAWLMRPTLDSGTAKDEANGPRIVACTAKNEDDFGSRPPTRPAARRVVAGCMADEADIGSCPAQQTTRMILDRGHRGLD
jgi:hypothetical protein